MRYSLLETKLISFCKNKEKVSKRIPQLYYQRLYDCIERISRCNSYLFKTNLFNHGILRLSSDDNVQTGYDISNLEIEQSIKYKKPRMTATDKQKLQNVLKNYKTEQHLKSNYSIFHPKYILTISESIFASILSQFEYEPQILIRFIIQCEPKCIILKYVLFHFILFHFFLFHFIYKIK